MPEDVNKREQYQAFSILAHGKTKSSPLSLQKGRPRSEVFLIATWCLAINDRGWITGQLTEHGWGVPGLGLNQQLSWLVSLTDCTSEPRQRTKRPLQVPFSPILTLNTFKWFTEYLPTLSLLNQTYWNYYLKHLFCDFMYFQQAWIIL